MTAPPRSTATDTLREGLVAGLLLAAADALAAGPHRTPALLLLVGLAAFAAGGLVAGLLALPLRQRGVALGLAFGGALAVHALAVVSKSSDAAADPALQRLMSVVGILAGLHYGFLAGLAERRAASGRGAIWGTRLLSAAGLPAASLAAWWRPDWPPLAAVATAVAFPLLARLVCRRPRTALVLGLAATLALPLPVLVSEAEPPRRFVPGAPKESAAPDAPNVVLVLVDTLRADHVGPELGLTPSLDALADEGATFTQAVSSASWTLPATSSILTALYPSQHGAVMATTALPGEVETLAEVFQRNGWETAAFTGGAFVGPAFGLDQGFEYFDHWAEFRWIPFRVHVPLAWRALKNRYVRFGSLIRRLSEFGGMPAVRERVSEWLEARPADRPFFLLVHTYQAHDYYIYHPDPDDEVRSALGPLSDRFEGRLSVHPSELVTASQDDLDWFLGLYRERIRYVDRELGALLDELEVASGSRELVVALSSDHGEGFDAELGRVHHGDRLHDDLLRVPLLLKAPGRVPPGTVVERQVRTIDLMPTLLELAGLEAPEGLAGRSLLDLLERRGEWPGEAFGEEVHPGTHDLALRTEDWKEIRALEGGEDFERFALSRDPAERVPTTQPLPEELRELWRAFRERFPARERTESAIDEATLDHLRALGYVE